MEVEKLLTRYGTQAGIFNMIEGEQSLVAGRRAGHEVPLCRSVPLWMWTCQAEMQADLWYLDSLLITKGCDAAILRRIKDTAIPLCQG